MSTITSLLSRRFIHTPITLVAMHAVMFMYFVIFIGFIIFTNFVVFTDFLILRIYYQKNTTDRNVSKPLRTLYPSRDIIGADIRSSLMVERLTRYRQSVFYYIHYL